ncbi:hypothetical protein P7C70_g6758, partial [Phenoliferia sp. Uapishka_3]
MPLDVTPAKKDFASRQLDALRARRKEEQENEVREEMEKEKLRERQQRERVAEMAEERVQVEHLRVFEARLWFAREAKDCNSEMLKGYKEEVKTQPHPSRRSSSQTTSSLQSRQPTNAPSHFPRTFQVNPPGEAIHPDQLVATALLSHYELDKDKVENLGLPCGVWIRDLHEKILKSAGLADARAVVTVLRTELASTPEKSSYSRVAKGGLTHIAYLKKNWLTASMFDSLLDAGRALAAKELGIEVAAVSNTSNSLESLNSLVKNKHLARYKRGGRRIHPDLLVWLSLTLLPGQHAIAQNEYTVTILFYLEPTATIANCTCEGFKYNKGCACKHIRAALAHFSKLLAASRLPDPDLPTSALAAHSLAAAGVCFLPVEYDCSAYTDLLFHSLSVIQIQGVPPPPSSHPTNSSSLGSIPIPQPSSVLDRSLLASEVETDDSQSGGEADSCVESDADFEEETTMPSSTQEMNLTAVFIQTQSRLDAAAAKHNTVLL